MPSVKFCSFGSPYSEKDDVEGKIGKRFGPACREPARGRDFAEQQIGKGAAARLPALTEEQEGVYGEFVEERKVDKSPTLMMTQTFL